MLTRIVSRGLSFLVVCLLAGCVSQRVQQDGPPAREVDVSHIPDAKPRHLPKSRYGNPKSYVVFGKRYHVLASAKGYKRRGIASWYGTKFHGQLTSSREPYNMYAMTAASPVLPIPSFVRVRNLENGRSVVVKVNDRGPFAPNRIIDLSYAAAKKLGYYRKGTALVEVAAIIPGDRTLPLLAEHSPTVQAETVKPQHQPKLYLQIGAFRNYQHASALKARIAALTHRAVRIQSTPAHESGLFKVQVGPLVGVGESDRLKTTLENSGYGDAITVIG
jgi:rare lipoprotein A